MKPTKAEIAAIVITIIFVAATLIISVSGYNQNAAATISLQAVPTPSHAPASSSPASPAPTATTLININTATAEELCALPGVGEVLSKAIVKYRTDYGLFTHISEIMDVSGMGIAKYEKLQSLITI
ncbi:MAG: helix-hairpin-helix domain-containing protein [Oscillospiraceae bacterium]